MHMNIITVNRSNETVGIKEKTGSHCGGRFLSIVLSLYFVIWILRYLSGTLTFVAPR